MDGLITGLVIAGALVVLLLLVVLWGFNTLRSAEQGVQKDWSNIKTELERRHSLVPNLVKVVREYAQHERETLDRVIQARNAATSIPADPEHAGQLAQAEGVLGASLGKLFALAEAYPDLKASDNYRQLQAELTDTEDRIAASRKLYNSSVEHLNTKTRTFPTNLMTGMAGVHTAEYYDVPQARMDQISADIDISQI